VHPVLRSIAIASALCPLLSPRANADDCGAADDLILDIKTTVKLGEVVDINLSAHINGIALLLMSDGQGPFNAGGYGTLCVDFPALNAMLIPLDSTGHATVQCEVPCDKDLVGSTFYFQFLCCHPKGHSNQVAVTVEDEICDSGDFFTYTPGAWGAPCNGGNAGCIRDDCFDDVFPNGLVIGDQDGPDADDDYAALFTSSLAIENYLPDGGKKGLLDQDYTDPTATSGGNFANQLVSVKLVMGFDDSGCLDDLKNRDDLKLGDLVFVSGVDADLFGMSVRDLVDLSDAVISGALGAGPYDLDGDTVGDVTLTDLMNALAAVNTNFDNGTQNNGILGLP
jgi:hypothetical protein